ncbi:anhydro-N-acetylmuramic acid kinase [Magnetospira thiophila]
MTEARTYTALGLMSGTSMDGIDIALLRTDGERVESHGPSATYPYEPDFRNRLRAILGRTTDKDGAIEAVALDLSSKHVAVVREFMTTHGLRPEDVDLIGFHGHTITHMPERKLTWQIGYGEMLAEMLGIETVAGFRTQDVVAGGQGAPLAPVYHRALARDLPKPLAVLNLGGVGNVTWIGPDGTELVAFDTGPGNALIDDWVLRLTGQPQDTNGALARRGAVDAEILSIMLAHPYFERPGPKSLDREAFASVPTAQLTLEDGAATLTAFTAEAVARSRRHLPASPRRWLVCGGGRHNPVLMDALRQALDVPVDPVEAVGWQGDALEAQAFAFLAVRCKLGLPISYPGTTGCPRPLTGGRFHPPQGRS